MPASVAPNAPPVLECPVCPRGALPPETTTCPNCRTDVGVLARLSALAGMIGLGEATRPAPVGAFSAPRQPKWLASAAAVGLAAGLVLGMRLAQPAPVATSGPRA